MFGNQTPSNIVWWSNILPFGHLVWCCFIVFDCVWLCLIKFEGHQTFDQKLKAVLLFSCLMGDVLFVWTAADQTCLMRACVPRLLSGLYQLFDLCLIKHVLTVWPLTSTLSCLVTKQCLMVFGRQTSLVCSGLNDREQKRNLVAKRTTETGDESASACVFCKFHVLALGEQHKLQNALFCEENLGSNHPL